MSIIKTLTQFIKKEAEVKTNKQTIVREWYRDYDGSIASRFIGPWDSGDSKMFIYELLKTGKAVYSFMRAVGYINERLRHGLIKMHDLQVSLRGITTDEVIELMSLDKEDIISNYNKMGKNEVKALIFNFNNTIAANIEEGSIKERLSQVYVICVIVDILNGVLPDLYNKEVEVYSVEKARRILNDFPIRAKKADTVELRSANLIIAAYCYGIAKGINWVNVADMLCNMTQYQNIAGMGYINAFKLARLDIDKLSRVTLLDYAKSNREVDKLFSMLNYIFMQSSPTFEGEIIGKLMVSESGNSYTASIEQTPNSKYYHYIVSSGFKIVRVPKDIY